MNHTPKVSVIVPVYGVEKYIERCARSLFEQTLDDIEYIFINDCTKDKSIDILQIVLNDYPKRKAQVKIIHNESNLGQAGTRTIGMKNATGQYIIHCDSDDWVDVTMYAKLYHKAKETDADVVVCNHYQILKDGKKVPTAYTKIGSPHDWLRKFRGSWNCWAKLVRHSLLIEHDIYPFEGLNFSEDRCMMMRAFFYANRIELVEEPLYYYDRTRSDAITKRYKTNINILYQREMVLVKMEEWFKSVGFDMGENMLHWKWQMSCMYLNMTDPAWDEWLRFLPETSEFAQNQQISSHIKYCYRCACDGKLLPIKLYYTILNTKIGLKSLIKKLIK